MAEKKTISIERFYAQNQVKKESVRVIVSNSFVDDEGNPIPWEIRPITFDENEKIMNAPQVTVEETDRRTGTKTYRTIDTEYVAAICAQAVVFPDLGDRGLQKSFETMTGKRIQSKTQLIKNMLTVGELSKLSEKVIEISDLGDDNSLDVIVGEVKN